MKTNKPYFTIIIKDNKSGILIDSLKSQSLTNWECFIFGNETDVLKEHIQKDKRFNFINNPRISSQENIKNIINQSNGDYIFILNSSDYFIPYALSIFTQMTESTESEVISYETTFSERVLELPDKEYTCIYRYLVRRKSILEYVFEDLSGFCFRKDFLANADFVEPENLFILKTLISTPAICRTKLVGVIHTESIPNFASVEYKKIIDTYIENKTNIDKHFWKNYFQILIPEMLNDTISQHNSNTLIYCCKKIPFNIIPWKYKFICLLFKLRRFKQNGLIEWQ
ncbi:MAG: glycosyltransferase family 2 protein [Alphaproteobacteria bacterium]|nr:glycosyltransferase family 2 protein [Alphaproteobacteria bacterium]